MLRKILFLRNLKKKRENLNKIYMVILNRLRNMLFFNYSFEKIKLYMNNKLVCADI